MTNSAPKVDELSLLSRAIELASLITAGGLLGVQALRFCGAPRWIEWWTPFAVLAGFILADFASGVVHWFADTWGSETMPLLGRRLLRPFRVHHVNPDDLLVRNVIDTNGDVATVVIPFLIPGLFLPLESAVGRAAMVVLAAMSVAALPTNQVHQWAHMPQPPKWVRQLQDWRVILSRREHLKHHDAPYATHYCIALGWCNSPLSAIRFFRGMERVITRLTGIQPRADEVAFVTQLKMAHTPLTAAGSRDDATAH